MNSGRRLFTYLLLFGVVAGLFLSFGLTAEVRSSHTINRALATPASGAATLLQALPGEPGEGLPRVAIIAGKKGAQGTLAWCQLNGYPYTLYRSPPPLAQAAAYDLLVYEGLDDPSPFLDQLLVFAGRGIPQVFLTPPDYEALTADARLADFFGVAACVAKTQPLEQMTLYGGFLLGGERIWGRGDDLGTVAADLPAVPWYHLRAGYKVFASGKPLAGEGDTSPSLAVSGEREREAANEELPVLLWRSYTGQGFVYVVNSPLFVGDNATGLLSAIMADLPGVYLYPIVNAQTVAAVNFPQFGGGDSAAIAALYSRDRASLTRSILWPDVVKIMDFRGGSVNLFMGVVPGTAKPTASQSSEALMYLRDSNKKLGVVGLSLSEDLGSSANSAMIAAADYFDAALPGYRFHALYTGGAQPQTLLQFAGQSGRRNLRDLRLMLSPPAPGSLPFWAEGEALLVTATHEAFSYTFLDDLRLLSLQTALGLYTQTADFSRVYRALGAQDDWSRLGRLWSSVESRLAPFAAFEDTDLVQMEERMRAYLARSYSLEAAGDTLTLRSTSPGYYLLRLGGKRPLSVSGGTLTRVEEGAWLLNARAGDVVLNLEDARGIMP